MRVPILTTARLTLQPFAAEDLDALHALWTDPHVRRYLWDDIVISRERTAETLAATLDGIGYWTLRQEPGGPAIGDCGFQLMDGSGEIELFYCLLPRFWGMGLAYEACQAALDYLWSATGYRRVFARADIPNENSIRLMRRLGMSFVSDGGSLATYLLARPQDR
jgi:ribosomal-protein-alanine N-acetyltransferase